MNEKGKNKNKKKTTKKSGTRGKEAIEKGREIEDFVERLN